MKLRVFLIALAGCLMLSACGAAETAPETSAAASETYPETPGPAAVDVVEATDNSVPLRTADVTTEPAAAPENRYQGWDYYNGYSYDQNGLRKYWIEFDDEFYLHCMFRSGEPEYYEAVYTLYPDWDAPTAQELTIRRVEDARGNDVTAMFEHLSFAFSSEDTVLMQVKRDEKTLAGGEEDNILTGDYVLLPMS